MYRDCPVMCKQKKLIFSGGRRPPGGIRWGDDFAATFYNYYNYIL